MNDLPNEILQTIMRWTTPMEPPVLRCVHTRWRALIDSDLCARRQRPWRKYGIGYVHTHDCMRSGCARKYILKAIERGLWGILDWMEDIVEWSDFRVYAKACSRAITEHSAKRLDAIIRKKDYLPLALYGKAAHFCSLETIKRICTNEAALATAAARHNRRDALDWIRARDKPFGESVCAQAAKGGHLDLLQWLRGECNAPWDADTCTNAARRGHLELLQWARENGCPWDDGACEYAAASGHFSIVKWLRANGCPWSSGTCLWAAARGDLVMLRWAHTNGCPLHSSVMRAALVNGHLDVAKWLGAHGYIPLLTKDHVLQVVDAGHLHILAWLMVDVGLRRYPEMATRAVLYGHQHILNWLVMEQYPLDVHLSETAARQGNIGVMQVARDRGCLWNSAVCAAAASNGHMLALAWARKQGCPWNESVTAAAARRGHLSILQWLIHNGCPYDRTETV